MAADLLLDPDFVVFSTREWALANGQALPSASRTLMRLAKAKTITRVAKGVWANTRHPYFTPLALVPHLLGPEQGYVSFLTALNRGGALSQIPPTIQVATTGHSRRKRTPVGNFEFFRLKPEMMGTGVEWAESKLPYRMATVEKALLDTLYLSTRKGRRFGSLPDLEPVWNPKKLALLIKEQVRASEIRTAIEKRLALM